MESLKVIKAKDLAKTMGVNVTTAEKYLKDIKQQYSIKIVLLAHITAYFKVNAKS